MNPSFSSTFSVHRYCARNVARQAGFTLIEIAIVLVIIGLLLGGVLQGQSMIRGMQVKDAILIAKDLTTASQYFKERYHYLPGDWVFTANEIPGTVAGGNGNGIINGAAEIANVPNHLFNSGYIKGGAGQITSRFGIVRVVGNTAAAGSVVAGGANAIPATVRNVIEFTNLPCSVAMEFDLKVDDGVLSTGTARASVANCTQNGANDPVPAFAVPL